MHVMLKRAAASAIPALAVLAVFPATAMAAPHTGQTAAGPATGARQTHEDPATTCGCGTVRFYWAPRPIQGGPATGIIAFGNDDKIIGNKVYANAGSGIDNSTGATVGNDTAGIAGNSLHDAAVTAG